MFDFLKILFLSENFIPHGHCYLWKPELVGLHITSDLLISLAYYSISITLFYFVRKGEDLPFDWIFLMFSVFIIACGSSHLMEIWTLWHPTYWISGLIKAITALASVYTAIAIIPLMPKILALPSPQQLKVINQELEQEIRVKERTLELDKINKKLNQEIVERKRIETKLSAILDNVGAYIYIKDLDSNYTYVNRFCCELLGLTQDEIIGCNSFDLFAKETALVFIENDKKVIQSGKTHCNSELAYLKNNDQPRHFFAVKVPLKNPDGSVYGICGISTDVTELKRAEEELKWKETLLCSMADASPLAFYVVDNRTDKILYFNHRFCQIWGLEHRQRAMKLGQLKHNDILPDCLPLIADRSAFLASCKALQDEANRAVVEDEIAFADGRTIRRFSAQIRDESDRYFGRLYLFEDISERQAALLERKQIEERMQALLKAMPDLMFRHRVDGTYLDIAGNDTNLVIPREVLIGSNLKDTPIPESIKADLLKCFETAVETGTLQTYEHDLAKPDGLHRYETRIIKSGADEVVCIVRDITERKQFTAALQESEERYRSVVTVMAEGIILQDANGEIRTCNASAERILGLSCLQMMGRTSVDPNWQPIKEDGSPFPGEEHPAIVTLGTGQPCSNVVMGVKKPDGSLTWISINSQPLFKTCKQLPYAVVTSFSDITPWKQAQAALRESEARFQAFMDNSPTAAWITDENGQIVYLSKTYSRMFNIPPNYRVGKTTHMTIYGADLRREYLKNIRRVVETNQNVEVIETAPRPDGTMGEFLVYKFPLKSASGQVLVGGIAIDITERKRVEEALKQSEERLQLALEGSGDGLWDWKLATGEVYYSPRYLEMLGYNPDEMPPTLETWKALIHPEDLDRVKAIMKAHFKDSSVPYAFDYRLRTKSGEWKWIADYGKVVARDQKGKPLRMTGTHRDVNERKRIEEALRKSEQRFRAIFNQAFQFVGLLQPDGIILEANQTALDFAGVSRDEVVGKPFWEAHWWTISPETQEQLKQAIAQATKGEFIRYEVDIWGKDDRVITIDFSLRPITDETGQVSLLIPEGRDITARKQAEEQLRKYQGIVAATRDGICLVDRDYTYQIVNPAYLEYHQKSASEVIGHKVYEIISPEIFKTDIKPSQERCLAGEKVQYEVWLESANRERHFLSVTYAPYVEANGVTSGVVVSLRNLTELKTAQKQLELQDIIVKSVAEGICLVRARDGIIFYANPKFERMFGYESGELNGKHVSILNYDNETIHAEAVHFELVKQVEKYGEYSDEIHQVKKDGTPFWCRATSSKFEHPEYGTIYVAVYEDISDRKHSEEALRSSQHFLQKVANATPHILYLFDLYQGTSIYLNQQSQTVLGYSPQELCGADPQWFINCFHPDDQYLCCDLSHRFLHLSEHEVLSTEYRFRHKDGEWRWLNTREVVFARDANGKPIEILGSVEDITERKSIEQALINSNERFQLAASAVKGMIYDWDLKLNTSIRTQGLFEITGYYPEEVETSGEWWNQRIHPEDLPTVSQKLSTAFATENSYILEYRIYHRDDHYLYLSDYGVIVRDENGEAVRAVGNVIDISDRKQAELILQEALVAAQAASVAKSRFLSNMSHELRTPLNAILGFSQMMARSNSLSDDQKEQLRIINRSGEHLLNLINDILSVSKIEAGQITLNETCFNLNELLDDLEQMLKLKAISKGLQLQFERQSDVPPYIQTDENKLRQVLINLLNNAIKFTQTGQVILRVRRQRDCETARQDLLISNPKSKIQNPNSPCQPSTFIFFEIEDTGFGIAPDELDNLFDPFVQTETGQRSMQGTGLGLAISRQFVELMGGEIIVQSQVGQGTIFSFEIQITEVAGADKKSSLTSKRVLGLAPQQSIYRILIVEDIEENRLLLIQILEPLGFEIRAAVHGEEAVHLWSTWKPHLIFMDMRMPVMDGYEATRQIKAREKNDQISGDWKLGSICDRLKQQNTTDDHLQKSSESVIPLTPTTEPPNPKTVIIALTASAFDQDQAEILSVGCDDFIPKPFQESLLFEKITQHLGVHFVYEEGLELSSSSIQSAVPLKLIPEDLEVMPSEWIAELHHAVMCANDQLILKLVEQIPDTEATLAETLRNLVSNFRLDILLDLTEALTHG